MGLIKKDGYIIKGVELKPAYAKIIWLELITGGNNSNTINASFGISTNRDNLDNGDILSSIEYSCSFDRTQDKILEQAYESAKADIFEGWEDDIVEEETSTEN